MANGIRRSELRGRRLERDRLDGLLRDVRDGHSRALVLRGEAGCGKTALLDHLAAQAGSVRVLRVAGVESESEIAYSALQQLCAPLLTHLDRLPPPQRDALRTTFGLSGGPVPERLRVGLGVLGLFAEAAAEQPLVGVVDDVQWVDAMSAGILAFVARRLAAESVALVFATRDAGDEPMLAGLPELWVPGLPDPEARALLDSVLTGPVDAHVRDRIVAETQGNPLALTELTRGLSAAELAFGFGGQSAVPLSSRMEDGFRRRIAALPPESRTVLLAAAVEPVGDAQLLWRALDRLGVGGEAVAPAEADGLIEFGVRVRFPHPLVRTAAWRSADAGRLRAVHAALAEVTDPVREPDRRAWHRAHAASGPDDEVAAELRDSAGRALARGGWSAAAAFLERAAQLTADPAGRGELLVEAAAAHAEAGQFVQVPELLGAAQLGPLDALRQARAERLRAQVAFMLQHGRAAVPPLLAAASRLEALDPVAARDAYLTAIGAAMYAGRFGGDVLRTAAEAARRAAPAGDTVPDLLLAGLTAWILDGRTSAVPRLHRALDAMTDDDADLVWLAAPVAHEVFRFDLANRMSERAVPSAVESGALSRLPTALAIWANSLIDTGRLAEAADLVEEIDAVTRATGASVYQLSRLVLAAYQGPEQSATALIEATLRDADARADGRLRAVAGLAAAMLHNGLGDHEAALEAASRTAEYPDMALNHWALRELVEASARTGKSDVAAEARERLAERTAATPTRTARGLQALADALAGPEDRAEENYRAAVNGLGVVESATQGHRARLLFGEWLRRRNRPGEARAELRIAYDAFTAMGAHVYAGRARRELAATGENVRERTRGDRERLTPQEAAIAQLAVSGRTNPQIASALFLSPRTVEWHLRKTYHKLGITSRRELAAVLTAR
ncbi:helix-turn-helix transcriptional regulator [Actinoplanes sp. HUAS TT8]|uniref:helix-turn-helix transcriptional regulator n=1 Tax=Actinoplanes sp. HUAS TT8 TaxID=3447453 RepID=UPI003F51F20F